MSVPDGVIRAYSYLRFSTPRQTHGDSFRRQQTMASSYAERHGLILDETLTFQDLGISAFRSRNAKTGALRAFFDAVESGLVAPGSVLLVESLDRISRDQILAAQGIFLQIISASITIVTLTDDRSYSQTTINNNPLELIISLVTMMRANEESVTKSIRLREAWVRRRALGPSHVMSTRGPAWLSFDRKTRKFRLIERHAVIVRRIFDEYLSGLGRPTIARQLASEGRSVFGSTKQGVEWQAGQIDRLLRSPNTSGTLVPTRRVTENGITRLIRCEPILDYYPAAVSRKTFEAAQVERKARLPNRGTFGAPLRNVLSGLARCHVCGGPMKFQSCKDRHIVSYSYLWCKRKLARDKCQAAFVRYEAIQAALFTRPADILATRSKMTHAVLEDRHGVSRPASGPLLSSVDGAEVPKSSVVDDFLRYQRLCEMSVIDISRANQLLKRCFAAVVVDPSQRQLVFQWVDGVIGSMAGIWPDDYKLPLITEERGWRTRRSFHADGETMHEAYGLLDGKRNGSFPLLTLDQVDEARQRYQNGESASAIAESMGVNASTLMRRVNPWRKDSLVRTRGHISDDDLTNQQISQSKSEYARLRVRNKFANRRAAVAKGDLITPGGLAQMLGWREARFRNRIKKRKFHWYVPTHWHLFPLGSKQAKDMIRIFQECGGQVDADGRPLARS